MLNYYRNIIRIISGITLIALVVTIVVLLILAGITISLVFSENGIIAKAREAAEKTNQAVINEQVQMNELAGYMENMLNGIGGGSSETPEEPELPSDGTYSESEGVNTPDLADGQLTPIKWDTESNDWVETTGDDEEWYDYTIGEWANAKTSDGSMWVWIPRYAYSITNGYHQSGAEINSVASTEGAGTISIEFLKGTSNEGATGQTIVEYNVETTSNYSQFPNGYVIHPAFNYGQAVSGLWVAKFEASHTGCTTEASTGETNTDNTDLTLQVKPGVTSWRNITIGNAYTVCLEYDSKTLENANLNSHMMKNDEWGAVAYLSKSEYGRDDEVWINNSSSYITGSAGNSVSASGNIGTNTNYTSTQGVHASTTDNVYGIYDMSGGSWERVSAYVDNSDENLTTNGDDLYTGLPETKNIYTIGSEDIGLVNYNANMSKYGDAIYETSSGTYHTDDSGTQAWFDDHTYFPFLTYQIFNRGGYQNDASRAGLFYFGYTTGEAGNGDSFRPVLVPLGK